MSHTSTHNYLHVVFGTKERASRISETMQPKLWAYMAGICQNCDVLPFMIGGMEDHAHLAREVASFLDLGKSTFRGQIELLAMDEGA